MLRCWIAAAFNAAAASLYLQQSGHWLFHGRAPASGTEVSLLPDRACGTLCRLRYDRWPATDSVGDTRKQICLETGNHGALWRAIFLRHTYLHTLNYLLTYLDTGDANTLQRTVGTPYTTQTQFLFVRNVECVLNIATTQQDQVSTPGGISYKPPVEISPNRCSSGQSWTQ